MSTNINVVAFDSIMRDMYPAPGSRVKQWVVDTWREQAWENETCPRVDVSEHNDNTGTGCRNVGRVPWTFLSHDCCGDCYLAYESLAERADVKAWLTLKEQRPPVCADRNQLSDQIAPDLSLRGHPALALGRK